MRSEKEKWKVPASDPAGNTPKERIDIPEPSGIERHRRDRSWTTASSAECAARSIHRPIFIAPPVAPTLVDAFHATEGLRVFERPDAASRIIEIVPSGTELDIDDDPDAPDDYVRIRLRNGRLGYIRLNEVSALDNAAPNLIDPDAPDPNVRAPADASPRSAHSPRWLCWWSWAD